jgi:hypothetical protein
MLLCPSKPRVISIASSSELTSIEPLALGAYLAKAGHLGCAVNKWIDDIGVEWVCDAGKPDDSPSRT